MKRPAKVALTLREQIAAQIRAQMAYRRVRQQDVAIAMNRSQQWVSRRLTGELPFTVDDLAEVCDVLGIEFVDLFDTDPEPAAPALDRRRGQHKQRFACNDAAAFVPFSLLNLAA